MKRVVTVQIPGTTSNLGPGFDTLGLALRTYNKVTVTQTGRDITARNRRGPVSPPAQEMVQDAADVFFARTKTPLFGCDILLQGNVPIARGLGSSVTVRLGVIAGLDALARTRLSRRDLLEMVAGLEHHPDNAAPAIYGGFAIAGSCGSSVRCLHFKVATSIRFVALIPEFEISTEAARRLVPNTFSKADTVHSLNRAALISAAFATGSYEELRGLFDDRLHQPYREKLLPQLSAIIAAGEAAGAIGGWLSGSGSTVICLAKPTRAVKVAQAMHRILPQSEMRILAADNTGVKIVRHGG